MLRKTGRGFSAKCVLYHLLKLSVFLLNDSLLKGKKRLHHLKSVMLFFFLCAFENGKREKQL